MLKYVVLRLIIGIPVLISVTIIIFALIEIAPGDISDYYITSEMQMTPEALAQIRARFGLDQPAPVRYLNWMANVLRGDLGYRFTDGRSVSEVISRRLSATATLTLTALGIGIFVGIPLGVYIGLRQYSRIDFILTGFSFLGISMPAFVTGILFLYIFSIQLGWFPAGGMRPVDRAPNFEDSLRYLALPSIVLSLNYIATYMRYTRFSVLEVVHSDYIRTARSKGLYNRRVTWRHLVPNALLPVITVIGLSIPNVVVGAVFTETVFSWPGMGTLYLEAVQARDIPLLMSMNLVIAGAVFIANLLTDLTYAFVDPRIRYE